MPMEIYSSTDKKRIMDIIDRKWQRLVETDNPQFYRHLKRLWEFININPTTSKIIERIGARSDSAESDAHSILCGDWVYFQVENGGEQRDLAATVKLLNSITGPISKEQKEWAEIILEVGKKYSGVSDKDDQYYLNNFYSLFIIPLLEVIKDEVEDI
ncbi:hypothetical protein JYT36_00530 [Bacteroidales bacterium AH-315-N07]|nr:hypothetical protein [Bacteroidales bacterium AH-315-N07]